MKKLSLLVAACFTIFALTSTAALAGKLEDIKERGSLRVGMEPGYMPFELTNQRGEIIGFDVDLAKRLAKELDVELELVSTAWDGIIPALLTDKFDIIMSGMTVTKERQESIDFAKPYIVVGQTILINKSIEGEVKSYKDLNDPKYNIASKLGTTGEQATKKNIPDATYISFETEQEGVLEVVNGKIDAFIYDFPFNAIAFSQRSAGKLVHLDKPFTTEPLAMGIKKGDAEFLAELNKFMEKVENNGTREKIYAKWFLDNAWLKEIQ